MAPPKAQSTSLRPYTPMPISNMAEMAELGKMIAASCMFGAKTAAEGVIIAGICHQANMSFLEFLETRHFYGGKVVMKADAMVARFNELGGTHKVMYRTADKAGIALTFNGVENAFTLTWDDVTKEPFIYRGGPEAQMLELAKPMEKRLIKDKYRTPVSRMQMMWARVVSDGVRTICPQACRGTYTPEEVSDFHEVEDSAAAPRVEKNVTPAAVKEKVAAAASAAAAPVKPAVTESAAPAVTVDPEAKPSAATPTSAAVDLNDVNVCPFGNDRTKGVRWDTMKSSWLEAALGSKSPLMTEGHRAVATALIPAAKAKEESAAKAKDAADAAAANPENAQ